MEDTMTTREIADVMGVSSNTILKMGLRLFPAKERRNGVAIQWAEDEVTAISRELKRTAGTGNSSLSARPTSDLNQSLEKSVSALPSTYNEVMERAKSALSDIISVLAEMKGTRDELERENAELRHQVEYNAVIGTTRWSDVKRLYGLHVNAEQMLNDTCIEEGVEYFRKCMGKDKYPTLLLTDGGIAAIRETYNISVEE